MRRVLSIAALLLALGAGGVLFALRGAAPSIAPAAPMRGAPAAADEPSFVMATPPAATAGRDIATEGAREPGSLAPPTATASPLDVQVRHADGAPAAGCVVVLARDGQPQWQALTDADGGARGAAVDGDVVVWVSGGTFDARDFPLVSPRGRVELELPAGETVQGWVLVDGVPPEAPFVLGLDTQARRSDVPPAVASLLAPLGAQTGADQPQLGQVVGAGGAFRFTGSERPWHTTATLPLGFAAEVGESCDLRAPDDARVLRLRRLPRLWLRVLMPDGRPAAAASVGANVLGGGTSRWLRLVSDADGRVGIPGLAAAPSESVHLTLASAAGDARRALALPVPVGDRDCDLGEVSLESAWKIDFRALDPAGAPLAGAVAGTECDGVPLRSEATGADGRGHLHGVPADCDELLVFAPLCEPLAVALPDSAPQAPLDVVLTPCTSLSVQVVAPDGGAQPGLTLVFRTRTHSQRYRPKGALQRDGRRLGATPAPGLSYDAADRDGDGTWGVSSEQDVPESGRVVVGCVEPGEPLDVFLVDRTRSVLWSREGITLQPAQQELITIPLAAQPGTLDVFVSQTDGSPLRESQVKISAPGPHMSAGWQRAVTEAVTDDAGTCRFENLYVPAVDVEMAHFGFATTKVPGVAVPGRATAVLSRGLDVTVHVVDAAGQPVHVDRVYVRRTDGVPLRLVTSTLDDSPDRPGEEDFHAEWRFTDLPAARIVIGTRFCARDVQIEHDARESEARLVVPATGALVVRGLDLEGHDEGFLTAEGDAGSDLRLSWGLAAAEPTPEVRWPLVLPGTWRVSLKAGYDAEQRVLRGPVVAEVRAGEVTTIDLR